MSRRWIASITPAIWARRARKTVVRITTPHARRHSAQHQPVVSAAAGAGDEPMIDLSKSKIQK
jgi:hypothetical protein